MPNYDFKSLSNYDFECLSRDLLQRELKITLESFKTGRDQGIDFRYSTNPSSKVIVQAKHFLGSSYATLFNHLKNSELQKVKNLSPSRYILTTCKGLTPLNKDTIKTLFEPYCVATADIYGQDDLNNLLGKFPDIEKSNFKLWLTSSAVLDKILHSGIYNQTEIGVEGIKKKLKYYVPNESFEEAQKILSELHYCIIAGMPGIGKTTLAEALLIFYLDQDYQIIKVSNDITEAVEVFESCKKQVFYYDDFLGQNNLKEKLNKNEDERLLQFIRTIKQSKNSKFIFTTREYILNQAKESYEKLAHSDFDLRKCVIDLSKYRKFQRAKILFNHIFFSNLPQEYKEALLADKNYLKIINHRNYNPRIIEGMCDWSKCQSIEIKDYYLEFYKNLNNPVRIWDHAFNKQIAGASRFLLIALYTLPEEVLLTDLEAAFTNFYNAQARKYRFSRTPGDFKMALKELDGNFVVLDKIHESLVVKFHNPSIRDFLENYLLETPILIEEVFESVIYFEQLQFLLGDPPTPFESILKTQINRDQNEIRTILDRIFYSKSPKLYTIQRGKITSRENIGFSIELRLLHVLKIVERISIQSLEEMINKIVGVLTVNVNEGNINKWALLELLKHLKGHRFNFAELLQASRIYFRKSTLQIEDYEYLLDLSEMFAGLYADTEIQEIRLEFEEFYISDIDSVCSEYDADQISQYSNDLEKIAMYLDIDVDKEIKILKKRYESILSDYPEDDGGDYERSIGSDDDSDEHIQELFEALRIE